MLNVDRTEYNDLRILFNLYSVDNTTKTGHSLFKLINFIVFVQIFAHFEMGACNPFQKS